MRYITPLKEWNPYNIEIVDKSEKDSIKCVGLSGFKCGCCEGKNSCNDPDSLSLADKKKCAWKGVSHTEVIRRKLPCEIQKASVLGILENV